LICAKKPFDCPQKYPSSYRDKTTHGSVAINERSLFLLAFQGGGAFLQRIDTSRAMLPEQTADFARFLVVVDDFRRRRPDVPLHFAADSMLDCG
jgi:hypothetical protein